MQVVGSLSEKVADFREDVWRRNKILELSHDGMHHLEIRHRELPGALDATELLRENLADQHESMRLFEQLARDEPALAGLPEWARRHLDIVARFGRFPHRNAVLGRESTAGELAFLTQPGSRF